MYRKDSTWFVLVTVFAEKLTLFAVFVVFLKPHKMLPRWHQSPVIPYKSSALASSLAIWQKYKPILGLAGIICGFYLRRDIDVYFFFPSKLQ